MNENFIKVNENNLDLIIDLRYASENNFTKKRIFFSDHCLLHKVAFEHLRMAVEIAKKIGLTLKIFAAYRPVSAQKTLW